MEDILKKYLFIFLLIQTQLVSSQELRPAFPYAGQNVEVLIQFSCGYFPSVNVQGQSSLVEFTTPNTIALYVVSDNSGVVIIPGCPPSNPHPTYYDIGALAEGTYTLEVFRVGIGETLPLQNVTPDSVSQFQVGSAPVAANTLSHLSLMLLTFGLLLFTQKMMKHRFK